MSRTGRHVALPTVQPERSAHDRPIVFEVRSRKSKAPVHEHDQQSLWPERPLASPHWEMAIDLDACTGCGACIVACQAENNIPVVGPDEMRRHRDMHWIRVDLYWSGDGGDRPLFQPMLCQHCDHAPCETVCPVAATVHSSDGLSQQVYNRCVGTRYCANNCPYKVRRFNWFDNRPTHPLERLVLNPDVVVRERGIMEKCTFCVHRIQRSRIYGKRGEAPVDPQPACMQSCPADAIRFGDVMDPGSDVARAHGDPRSHRVLADLGVRPSVTYQARVRQEGKTS